VHSIFVPSYGKVFLQWQVLSIYEVRLAPLPLILIHFLGSKQTYLRMAPYPRVEPLAKVLFTPSELPGSGQLTVERQSVQEEGYARLPSASQLTFTP
jgi:hypothetical protein